MDHNLSFRTDRYNFWPIYEAIKTYYPLGITQREGGIYYEYSGMAELNKIVVDNVHEKENFQSRWQRKVENWSNELKYEIVGTTYGQEPSFSGYIALQKDEINDKISEKRLHIAVSLIGPFYTLFETDVTTLIERNTGFYKGATESDRFYQKIHRTAISPYGEYAHVFDKIRILIENDFKEYRFVPYMVHSAFLEGLQVRYRHEKKNRIYHALFNQLFDFNAAIVRDEFEYGRDQWFIHNPNMKNNWIVTGPK